MSRKASPKGFSLGNALWQVWQDVWYFREKTGTAVLGATLTKKTEVAIDARTNRRPCRRSMFMGRPPFTRWSVRGRAQAGNPAVAPIRLVTPHQAGRRAG